METDTERSILTHRQREILRLAAEGLTREEICAHINFGKDLVKTETKMIRLKLGARNIPHAVAIAFKKGILL